ncbi:MAG TPA: thioredoxin family protein [Syntrophorhabdales bacterium]|nr:thioredoxin family protein [Syntrophorhabdales bacterium]
MAHKLVSWSIVTLVWLCTVAAWMEPVWGEQLTGKITTEQLYSNAPVFKQNAQKFCPDPMTTEKVRQINWNLTIIVFLGTWCVDSKREVPKLLKILEAANNQNISLELYAVDTKLQDGEGLTKKYGVKAVATIIFFDHGRELGRIIESPKTTLERDFLDIVGVK